MRSIEPVAPSNASDSLVASIQEALGQLAVIAEFEVRKLLRDPLEIFVRSLQPVLWLLVFGPMIGRLRALPEGTTTYVDFLTPGILGQSVLFASILHGSAAIWERDMGLLHKLLASPARRWTLVLGKASSAGVRAVAHAAVVYLAAIPLRVHLRGDVVAIGAVFAVAFFAGSLFATLSLVVACLARTRERFMSVGPVLTMPAFLLSNAIYPISQMPGAVKVLALINPLTYVVDAVRGVMISGAPAGLGFAFDAAVLGLVFVALTMAATRLYPSIVQ